MAAFPQKIRVKQHLRYGVCLVILALLFLRGYIRVDLFNFEGNAKFNPIEQPLIFIGGFPSSGTTLTRVLLDAHPMIRCGGESWIIKEHLEVSFNSTSKVHLQRINVGVTQKVIEDASRDFVFKIIQEMGPPAPRLCHKRPKQLLYMNNLARMFPKAKFVFVIRDARATLYSTIVRGVEKLSFATLNRSLQQWNNDVGKFLMDCKYQGPSRCYMLYYERLVLNTEFEMKRLLAFLDVPWDPIVLRHHEIMTNITHADAQEPTRKQVREKIQKDSLYKWTLDKKHMPIWFTSKAVMNDTVMKALGYTRLGYPPDYAKL